jgi:hypothetical protein
VLRGLRRRLDRLWASYRRAADFRAAEREARGARESFVTTLRAGLARAGIDADTVPAMRRFAPPDPAASPAERSRRPSGPVEILCDRLSRLARRCLESPPDLATATPMELFVMYCLGDIPAAAPSGFVINEGL